MIPFLYTLKVNNALGEISPEYNTATRWKLLYENFKDPEMYVILCGSANLHQYKIYHRAICLLSHFDWSSR